MNNLLTTSYDLELLPNGTYTFITDYGIRYIAPFSNASEFFPNRSFANQVFLFAIRPLEENAVLPAGVDPRLGPTAAKILRRKFNEDATLVILYVCATEDKKELVRLRKFDQYYDKHNKDEAFTKTKISDLETNIHGAVIYESGNPDAVDISTAALEIPSLFI